MNTRASRKSALVPLGLFGAAFVAAGLVCPLIGGERLDLERVVSALLGQGGSLDADIFLFQRVPRVALGLLAGGALAAVGAVLQVVLRNPLAEPYTVGVTGGAAVGAVLAAAVGAASQRAKSSPISRLCAAVAGR